MAENCEKFFLRDSDDDDRMNFLFSAFPKERNVNPRHWDSKMNYWVEETKRCCLFYRDICINCELLKERCSRNDRTPQGLGLVLLHMEKQGLITNQDYLLSYLGSEWLEWTYSIMKKSSSWISSVFWRNNATVQSKDYVIYETLDVIGMEVLTRHYEVVKFDRTDYIVPWNVVKNFYIKSKSDISDKELLLVVARLKMKKLVEVVTDINGEKVIKFARNKDSKADAITDNDLHILRLKKAIAKLKLQIADENREVKKIKEQAVFCIKIKDQDQAKRLVFQKQKLKKSLDLKQDALLSLTEQLTVIRNTDSTKMILDAINSSAIVLKSTLEREELSLENVDEAFEKSTEAIDYAKEIDTSITQGLKQLEDDVDLQELENELSDLLLDAEPREESQGDFELPPVPAHDPREPSKKNAKKRALAN